MGVRENVPGITDEHHVSEIGRLFMGGQISQRQYEAGIDYATTILDYLKTIDAPAPYGADLSDFTDDQCLQRKIDMARARKRVNATGKKAALVVDRVTVYGEQLAPGELKLLSDGLKALSENQSWGQGRSGTRLTG